MNAVITGFDAFSRHPFNPTGEVIKDLRSVSLSELFETVDFSIIQTSYNYVDKWVEENRSALLESDLIIMLGLSEFAPNLKLEFLAQNVADCEVPDNDGQVRQQSVIANSGLSSYQTSIEIAQVAQNLEKANEPSTISNNAGLFVCNYLYYTVLNLLCEEKSRSRAIFAHVPWIYPVLTQEHFNLSPRDRHLAVVKKLVSACQSSITNLS